MRVKMDVPITHKCYLITGFVLSGKLYFTYGNIILPSEDVEAWEMLSIPGERLIDIYGYLEKERDRKSTK